MLSRRLPGERTDLWIVRYNNKEPSNFWGFEQLKQKVGPPPGWSEAKGPVLAAQAGAPEGCCFLH